ncbi:hypothetical protein FBY12_1081 [Pseudomonas sp. SJZ131]|nr:hypothetical protein FBY12_1081 [Pseudomonas sp. SJZ131]
MGQPSAMGKPLLHSLFVRLIKQVEHMLRMLCATRVEKLRQHTALMRTKFPNSHSDHHFLRAGAHQVQIRWVLTPKL